MSKPYVLGIDIGGTNTVFGIVDARGHIIASDSIKLAKSPDLPSYIQNLHDGIQRLLEDNDAVDKIQGIGIGAPNGNYYTGEIVKCVNLPFLSFLFLSLLLLLVLVFKTRVSLFVTLAVLGLAL